MAITKEQFERIRAYFPIQRGNVGIENHLFINAILYMAENGCKWRALPEKFGNWNTVYKRYNRWVKSGVIARIFTALQLEKIISIKVESLSFDSTSFKVHPDGHGALKKPGNSASESRAVVGTPNFTWLPQITRLSLKCTSRAENVTTRRKGANQ
jgi:transposase